MNQFGIKLRDAEPIWAAGEWASQEELWEYLTKTPFASLSSVGRGGLITINVNAVEAICGPNDPLPFDIYRR